MVRSLADRTFQLRSKKDLSDIRRLLKDAANVHDGANKGEKTNVSSDEMLRYSGTALLAPYSGTALLARSDERILKLKGDVTALNAKKNEIEHSMEHVKKYVPEQDRTAALGQFKKDLSDIRHMLEEAETTKEHDNEKKGETKGETKGEKTNVSSRSTQIWRQKNGGYPQI